MGKTGDRGYVAIMIDIWYEGNQFQADSVQHSLKAMKYLPLYNTL
jgi:hypothetical protein